MHIPILPPDINAAGKAFTATPQGIRFAMNGIKGIGTGVVESILEERRKGGRFTSLYNFLSRIGAKKAGKKTAEHLIDAGAFDYIGWTRDELQLGLDQMFEAVVSEQTEAAAGFLDLFANTAQMGEGRFSKRPAVKNPRSAYALLLKEKELLGFFLTGHPMSAYQPIMQRLSCVPLARVEEMSHDAVFRAAFIVETVQIRFSAKSQKKFAILTISDGYDGFELPIWADLYEEKQHLLKENQLLYAVLQVDKKEESTRLSCRWLDDLTQANEAMMEACDRAFDRAKAQAARFAKKTPAPAGSAPAPKPTQPKETLVKQLLTVTVDADQARLSHVLDLKALFEKQRGSTPVKIEFHSQGRSVADLHIDPPWGVDCTQALQAAVKAVKCVKSVSLG
jgi:DNA polymerase-3 subunit alpha